MIDCPYCGHENIEGVVDCEECGQPVGDTFATPNNEVERGLIDDHVDVLDPNSPPLTVNSDTSVRDVLATMVEKSIGCVIVTEGDALVGIFTERDALLKINADIDQLADRPVSEFMTSNPQTLARSAKVAFAVQRMDLGGYRHVPIVSEQGGLDSIISVRDILRYLTDRMTAT